MRRKKWVVAKTNKDLAASTAQELSIDPLAALLVTSRGFDDINSIDEFFDPDAPLSLDPFSIKDMDLAAERINRAIDDFELSAFSAITTRTALPQRLCSTHISRRGERM